MEDELRRYVEYLQQQLLTSGSEGVHDTKAFKEWVTNNRSHLVRMANYLGHSPGLVDEFFATVQRFEPSTKYDLVTAEEIFRPVLDSVLESAAKLKLAPVRPVILATSTSLSSSPMSRPSSGDHLLFAGIGTFAFCNYWAKLFSLAVARYVANYGSMAMTKANLRDLWSREPKLLLVAAKLVAYYRSFGTLVGFGEIPVPLTQAPLRLELLFAMELFVVSHEVGHFYFQEQDPATNSEDADQRLEYACDRYAVPIMSASGNHRGNWAAFAGAGALLFLRAASLSERQDLNESITSATHPPSKSRATVLLETCYFNSAPESAVVRYIEDFEVLCDELEAALSCVLGNVLS